MPMSVKVQELSSEPISSKDDDLEVAYSGSKEYHPPPRVVRSIYLTFLAYFIISGGPFGMESTIRAAGPFITLLGLILMPIFWAIPQVLMTAELSCMMSHINGGYVVWVQRAFGDFIGWMNSYNNLVCNVLDAALFPVIVADYFKNSLSVQNELYLWLIKGLMLFFCLCLNAYGIELAGKVAVLLSFIVLTPFVIQLFYRMNYIQLDQWTYTPPKEEIRWPLFLSTLLWLYSGFDDTGALAAEVDQPAKTYVRGLWSAIFLVFISYVIPATAALTFTPLGDYHKWHDGFFAKTAMDSAPWLGSWVLFAVMCSNVAQYNSNMVTDSRVIWSMAIGAGAGSKSRKLPKFLSWSWKARNTPVAAIILQTILVCVAMAFPFHILVQCDTYLNCITLLCEFAAFMYLKYYEPNTERPFVVPGGKFGAWLITLPKLVIIGIIFALAKAKVIKVAIYCNILFILLYFIKKTCDYFRICEDPEPDLYPIYDTDSKHLMVETTTSLSSSASSNHSNHSNHSNRDSSSQSPAQVRRRSINEITPLIRKPT